jgi:hypothetical protein
MNLKQYSPIVWAIERLFFGFKFFPPQFFLWYFVERGVKLSSEQVRDPSSVAKGTKLRELYVVGCLVLDGTAFGVLFSGRPDLVFLAVAWAGLRIFDILQAVVNMTLFDALRAASEHYVASFVRLVVLGYVNFAELIINFASIYGAFPGQLQGAKGPWDALYFSVITQLTIGYGDILPMSGLRAVVGAQALGGLAFLALVFVRTISALPEVKQILDGKEGP